MGDKTTRKGKQNYKAANQKMAEVLSNFELMNQAETTGNRAQMFADTVREWMDLQRGLKPPSTVAGYQYAANDVILYFDEIAPVKTTELTSSMVERYLIWEYERRQSGYMGEYKARVKYKDGSGVENTVKHRATLIRSVLQHAKRDGLVDRNVASSRDCHINLPSPQRNVFPILTVSEANRLMRHLKDEPLWFHVATLMGLLIALRRSEVIGTCESEINWEQNRILIDQTVTQQTIAGQNTITRKPFTKNRKAKDLLLVGPLSPLVKELIEEHKKNQAVFGEQYDHTWDGYLIRYPDGKLVSPNALTNKFKEFLEKHNLEKIRFHDLRHSCASILCAKGVNIRVIQGILGHAQLSTTQIYTQIINDQQDTALIQMSEEIMGEFDET